MLVPGFLAIVVLVAAVAALAAGRVSRRRPGRLADGFSPLSRPRLAAALARSALPLTTVIGVRLGLERGRGRSAVPIGTALVGAVAAVTGVAAALTFGSSLHGLVNSSREQGWNWNVLVGNPNTEKDPTHWMVPGWPPTGWSGPTRQ